ncbi:hypothetical protein TNCV_3405601 [Trichonephila clavipes]|nr:hypothetical protein TNCV_3405601 [Trichonephila clavipes]
MFIIAQPTPTDKGVLDAFKQIQCVVQCVQLMCVEAMTIHAGRSSTESKGVLYTIDFSWPQEKKLKGLRTRECKGQTTG